MGTTAEKLQYLNETKGMIKTAIKDKGVEIADTDTFRIYVDKIGEIPTTVVEEVVKSEKYGMTMDSFLGDVDENGVLQSPSVGSFNGVGIKGLKDNALQGFFQSKQIVENVTFPDLITLSAQSVFYDFCYNVNSLKTVNFPNLESVSGMWCFQNAFKYSSIQTLSFPKLITAAGMQCFKTLCTGCRSLTTVNFEKLESITQSNIFQEAFQNCTNLTSVNFSSLREVTGGGVFNNAFNGCTSLTSISFPSLTSLAFSEVLCAGSSSYMFNGCTGLTEIHFRADAQATIESSTGYADKWGAVNATIYFDL